MNAPCMQLCGHGTGAPPLLTLPRSSGGPAFVCLSWSRATGRVHPAVISGYNEATHSVTVEWFENDETKGKEIDVRHVMSLKENQVTNQVRAPAVVC